MTDPEKPSRAGLPTRSAGLAETARLPERVRAAIRDQEDRSEVLIG